MDIKQPQHDSDTRLIVDNLLGLGIDYLRWTQMVPMILGWAALIIMVVAMTAINYSDQTVGLLVWLSEFWNKHSWLPQFIPPPTNEQGGYHLKFDEESFSKLVFRTWGLIALVLWLLSSVKRWIFGPKPPTRLSRKLFYALAATGLIVVVFTLNFFLNPDQYQDSYVSWLPVFVLLPLGVFLLTVYGLSVSHVLSALQRGVFRSQPPI